MVWPRRREGTPACRDVCIHAPWTSSRGPQTLKDVQSIIATDDAVMRSFSYKVSDSCLDVSFFVSWALACLACLVCLVVRVG